MTGFSNAIPPDASYVRIEPGQFAGGTVSLPGSKSLTNRALVLAAMARGESRLNGVLESIDTRVMLDGLSALGFGISEGPGDGEVRIVGAGGRVPALSLIHI